MTVAEATRWALSVHGTVWVAAAAAYYKYGDRTKLFRELPKEGRRLRQAVLNKIASELAAQLRPVVRDSTSVRSNLLSPGGDYIEGSVDITVGERYYQAIHDFVTNASGALVDYRLVLATVRAWRVWAHRLSWSILILVVLEPAVLLTALVVLVPMNETDQAPLWLLLLGSLPTVAVIVGVFLSLILVHMKQGVIIDLEERYDTNS